MILNNVKSLNDVQNETQKLFVNLYYISIIFVVHSLINRKQCNSFLCNFIGFKMSLSKLTTKQNNNKYVC